MLGAHTPEVVKNIIRQSNDDAGNLSDINPRDSIYQNNPFKELSLIIFNNPVNRNSKLMAVKSSHSSVGDEGYTYYSIGKIFYTYMGDILKEATSYSISSEYNLYPSRKYCFEYENDLVSKVTTYNYYDDTWINLTRLTNIYNEEQNISRIQVDGYNYQTQQFMLDQVSYYIYQEGKLRHIIKHRPGLELFNRAYLDLQFYYSNDRPDSIKAFCSNDSLSWLPYYDDNRYIFYNREDQSNYAVFQKAFNKVSYDYLFYYYPFPGALIDQISRYNFYPMRNWYEFVNSNFCFNGNGLCAIANVTSDINSSVLWYQYLSNNQIESISEDYNDEFYETNTYYQFEYLNNNQDIITNMSNISVKAYPNPFRENLELTVNSKDNLPVHIRLFNIKGHLLIDQTSDISRNNNIQFNTKALSSGVYFLKVSNRNDTKTCKIIKIK